MTVMWPMQIVGIQRDAEAGISAVLLGDSPQPDRVLPIMIGPQESESIIAGADGLEPARPGTHDLMASLLEAIDARLDEVVVTELLDGVLFAELFVEGPTGMESVSARPSDGVALAMRLDVPIMVAGVVLDQVAVSVERGSGDALNDDEIDRIVGKFGELLAQVTPRESDDG